MAPVILEPPLISDIDIRKFGARLDGFAVADGAMSSAGSTLTCATTTPFAASDVGKLIMVSGAGVAGAPVVGTISGFTSSSVVTVSGFTASQALTDTYVVFGSDDLAAWDLAVLYCSLNGGEIRIPNIIREGQSARPTILCASGPLSVPYSGVDIDGGGGSRNQDAGASSTFRGVILMAMGTAGHDFVKFEPPTGASNPALKTSSIRGFTIDGNVGVAGRGLIMNSVQQADSTVYVKNCRDVNVEWGCVTPLGEAQDVTGTKLRLNVRAVDDPIRQTTPFTAWTPATTVNGAQTIAAAGNLNVASVAGFPSSGTIRIPLSVTVAGVVVKTMIDVAYTALGAASFNNLSFTNPFPAAAMTIAAGDPVETRRPSNAKGLRLGGTSTANSSFSEIDVSGTYIKGTFIEFQNSDSMRIQKIHAFRGGGSVIGPAVDCFGHNTDAGQISRANHFAGPIACNGGFIVRGTESFANAALDGKIDFYSRENGEPLPIVGAGATLDYFASPNSGDNQGPVDTRGCLLSRVADVLTIPVTTETLVTRARIPANFGTKGAVFHIRAIAITAGLNVPTWRVKLGPNGSTADTEIFLLASAAGVANGRIGCDFYVTIRTVGTAGTVVVDGYVTSNSAPLGKVAAIATPAIDTTVDRWLDLTLAQTINSCAVTVAEIDLVGRRPV